MEMRHLRYFLALAEQEHVSNAANMLNLSQPALSRSVAALEKEIGVTLFERCGNHIRLNDNGKEFAIYARQALETLETGIHSVQKVRYDIRGVLRIACHAFADNLLDCIDAYTELNPYVQVQLFQSQLADSHMADKVDFILASDSEAQLFTANNDGWVSKHLWSEEMVILISPMYREYPETVTELPLIDLRDDRFTGTMIQTNFMEDLPNRLCTSAGFTPRYFSITDDFLSGIHFVGEGKAIAILPEGCFPVARKLYPDIRSFKIKGYYNPRNLFLLRKKESLLGEAGIDFWNFLINYYELPEGG